MEEFEKILGKDNPLLKIIKERRFEKPSEIQEKSIPEVLKGKDVIAGASTGSGKTLAFAAGLIKNVKKDFGIQGLVLTPTRELAEQVSNELIDFSRSKDLDVVSIYGGVSIIPQIKRLAYTDIVVGTPGRILDHLQRNSIDLSKVNTLVLDEADRMLDMGFIDDVEKIISNCPKKRQTMLFSATISEDIARLSQKYLKDPIEISAKSHVDPKKLEQVFYDVDDNLKYSLLKHLLENEKSNLVMVFCNTRKNVDFIANNLKFMGIDAVAIHGGYSQEKRSKMLEIFNAKKVNVLIATDVAARGLDIKGVSHIYNYDMPPNKNEYTHRIGRTARAGKQGKVINILSSRDYENFHVIKSSDDFNIKKEETPYIQRARIRWMPEKRNERISRRRNMSERGIQSKKSGYGRRNDGSRSDNRRPEDRPRFSRNRTSNNSFRPEGSGFSGRSNTRSEGNRFSGRSNTKSEGNRFSGNNNSNRGRFSGNSNTRSDNRRSDNRRNDRFKKSR